MYDQKVERVKATGISGPHVPLLHSNALSPKQHSSFPDIIFEPHFFHHLSSQSAPIAIHDISTHARRSSAIHLPAPYQPIAFSAALESMAFDANHNPRLNVAKHRRELLTIR